MNETCDHRDCPAHAYVTIVYPNGHTLKFCQHHAREVVTVAFYERYYAAGVHVTRVPVPA